MTSDGNLQLKGTKTENQCIIHLEYPIYSTDKSEGVTELNIENVIILVMNKFDSFPEQKTKYYYRIMKLLFETSVRPTPLLRPGPRLIPMSDEDHSHKQDKKTGPRPVPTTRI